MPAPRKTASRPKNGNAKPAQPRLSRTRRPPDVEIVDWQTALRRQFGREQVFGLENLGADPVFSDFRVHNPESGSQHRVSIRGRDAGQNFCSCADFATNDLGTCKHIEFTLGRLEARRGGKAALARGFEPEYSEVWLDYAGARQVRFRAGTACPAALLAQAKALFDPVANWPCPRNDSTAWSRCCAPPGSTATSCAATTMSGSSSPRFATANAGRRHWPMPTRRASRTRR